MAAEDKSLQFNLKRQTPDLSTNYDLCIICQSETLEQMSSLTSSGFPTLLYAVSNRSDDVAQRLKQDMETMDLFLDNHPQYHSGCYKRYTNKKTVHQKKAKTDTDCDMCDASCSSSSASNPQPMTRSKSDLNIDLKTKCFICEKERDKRGERKLYLISTKDREQSIWKKANELNNKRLMDILRGPGTDMVSNDVRYHKVCLEAFMNKRVKEKEKDMPEPESDSSFNAGFMWLVSEIEPKLLTEGCVYFVSHLRDMLCEWLRENEPANPLWIRNSRLEQKLKNYFGDRINIVPQTSGPSNLLCSSALSMEIVMEEIRKLKSHVEDCVFVESGNEYSADEQGGPDLPEGSRSAESFHIAKSLRGQVKSLTSDLKKKCDGRESGECEISISYEGAKRCVPNDLYNHLAWMLNDTGYDLGQDGRVQLEDRQHEKVLNLAQDICSSIANTPTPKQIGTAIHITKQSRSKDTVTLLNRLGNCIGYQDAQRYIATMAKEVTDQEEKLGFFVPSNLVVGPFAQFAMDNLDFHENNLDGKTTHGTTHIVYQYQDNPSSNKKVSVPVKKSRSVSVSPVPENEPRKSMISSLDRKQGRSLSGLKLRPDSVTSDCSKVKGLNTLYNICQMGSTDLLELSHEMNPLSWKAFHRQISEEQSTRTVIGYGPFTPEPPTNPDIVMKGIDYCMSVSKYLSVDYCVLTCDQAIYEIALALQKKYPDKYQKLILRMGGFHILMNFLGAIGRLMEGTGLEQLMIEGGVCQPGTAKKIMGGNDYYQMLHAHSLVETAVMALLWEAFEVWLVNESNGNTDDLSAFAIDLGSFCEMVNNKVSPTQSADIHKSLQNVMKIFDKFLQQNTSPTCQLWLMYLEMIGIVKRYIYAERAGVWSLHLATVEEMLPYLVSAGHTKYTACLPQYINAMKNLPQSVLEEFEKGNFVVRRKEGKFNGVWTDLALEQTYNKDAKTKLYAGITKNQAAIAKYLKALPIITAISEQTLHMARMTEASESNDSIAAASKDREILQKLRSILNQRINPFSRSDNLVNIITGQMAASNEVLDAKEKGLKALALAEEEQAFKVQPVRLKPFASVKKKTPTSKNEKKLHMDESDVSRSLCFATNLSNKEKIDAFAHEWAEYPCSLFKPDDDHPSGYAMRKGTKADYLVALQTTLNYETHEQLPESLEPTSYCIDMMAFVQQFMDMGSQTFYEMQQRYLKKIVSSRPQNCNVLHIVGDSYDTKDNSLKFEERQRRMKTLGTKTYVPHHQVPIPKWNDFIANHENKSNLLKYLQESWIQETGLIPDGCSVVVGGFCPGPAVIITCNGVSLVSSLACPQHEEADTRIFAHATYSVSEQGCTRVVIRASDTDIIIMGIYHCTRIPDLKEMWIKKFVSSENPDAPSTVFIPCHSVSELLTLKYPLNEDVQSVVLAAYTITGCDTVSYPFRIGKKRALKTALESADILGPVARYGEGDSDLTPTAVVLNSARAFYFALYGRKDFSGTLDELRCHLFITKKGDIRSLPCTEDAFQHHVKRGLHQLAIYKRAAQPEPSLPDPCQFGRRLEGGCLIAQRMTKPAKPHIIKTFCKCKNGKCGGNCQCKRAGPDCNIGCLCSGNPLKCKRFTVE